MEATSLKFIRIIDFKTNTKTGVKHELRLVVLGCRSNDRSYQKYFYEKFFGYALKIVFRYIYSYDNSVDVVNDGFVKIFRNFQTFECENEQDLEKILFGWIRRIMINTAIDELRRNKMTPEIGGIPDYVWDTPDKSYAADDLVLYKELVSEIKKLPPSYRAVFNMFVIDGLSHQEIAQVLDISVGTSKSSLSKARTHLQKLVQRNFISDSYVAAQ